MRFLLTILAVLLIGLVCLTQAEDRPPIQPDFLMDRQPKSEFVPQDYFLNDRLFPLWKKAIKHPEAELQRQVALAVARAHAEGFPGLDQFRPDLLHLVKQEQLHPATRFAAARALIMLESKESATELYELSRTAGLDFRMLIEPALGRWGFEPIRSVWRARLKSTDTSRRELRLAIDGLVENQEVAAVPDLVRITQEGLQPADLRISAARGAAVLTHEGLEKPAREVLSRSALIDRLCAVTLLSQHQSPTAIEMCQTLAVDPEPAVASVALQTLFQINPDLVLPVAEHSLASRDAMVRRVAIETYLKRVTVERLRTLSAHLNDPHPQLRSLVREGFFTHSRDPQYEPVILETTTAILWGDDWRGQEQASLLLVALDRKEVAPRLVELLQSERDEVMIATAWGLRVLAVPDTAPAMLSQIRVRSEPESLTQRGITHQIAHLSEALAVLKHRPAIGTLKIFIPKTIHMKYHEVARAGAIYALGILFQDADQGVSPAPMDGGPLDKTVDHLGLNQNIEAGEVAELAELLMGRVKDFSGMPPEFPKVRRASALAIGLMGAKTHVESLKQIIGKEVSTDAVELAMRWAVHRMTGELLPLTPLDPVEYTGWFLEPTIAPATQTSPIP